MTWIGQMFDTPSWLKTRLLFGIVAGLSAVTVFVFLLFEIERHNTNYRAAAMEAELGERDTQLEIEDDYGDELNNDDNSDRQPEGSPKRTPSGDSVYKPGDSRRRALSRGQKGGIIIQVSVLLLLNYLLLVFLPGSVALSFVAVTATWALTLHSYLRDELRRRRCDRVITLIALFFIIAGCLALVTYCRLALQEGSIYEGPARIVGYDDSVYSNKDGQTLRADLQVAWGGGWGCPETGKQCTAFVSGALCETEYKPEEYDSDDADGGNRRRLHNNRGRFLAEDAAEDETDKEEEEVEEEVTEEVEEYEEEIDQEDGEELEEDEEEVDIQATEEVEVYEEELDEEYGDEVEDLEEEQEELVDYDVEEQTDNEELEEEKDALEEENEELEQDLEDEEEVNEELRDEIDAGGANYEDDMYTDDYWNMDWESVWGDYACEDLFDSDTSGESYNPDLEAGLDQWPTIKIFGSCNSCQAYIVDYYSTEHFISIRIYALQSLLYLALGFFIMIVAAVAAIAQRLKPTKEKEVVLLTHEGGVPA